MLLVERYTIKEAAKTLTKELGYELSDDDILHLAEDGIINLCFLCNLQAASREKIRHIKLNKALSNTLQNPESFPRDLYESLKMQYVLTVLDG